MNSPVVIELAAADGNPRQINIKLGQTVLIGSSLSADLVLPSADDVALQHCEVTYSLERCKILSLDDHLPILVNQILVKEAILAHGDRVKIGNEELTIHLEGIGDQSLIKNTVSPNNQFDSKASQKTTENPSILSAEYGDFVIHENGVASLVVNGLDSILSPLRRVDEVCWKLAILLNHRLSRLETTPPGNVNLFRDLEGTLPEGNDLRLFTSADIDEVEAVFERYSQANSAATLAMFADHELEFDELTADIKYIAAWFLVPQKLEFHLTQGTGFLADKVFSLVDVLVAPALDSKKLVVMQKNASISDWPGFVDWIGK